MTIATGDHAMDAMTKNSFCVIMLYLIHASSTSVLPSPNQKDEKRPKSIMYIPISICTNTKTPTKDHQTFKKMTSLLAQSRASGLPTFGAHCKLFLRANINLAITFSSFLTLNPLSSSSSTYLFTGAVCCTSWPCFKK